MSTRTRRIRRRRKRAVVRKLRGWARWEDLYYVASHDGGGVRGPYRWWRDGPWYAFDWAHELLYRPQKVTSLLFEGTPLMGLALVGLAR